MFNTNITNVLSQVQGITNSVVLKYPNTIVNSPAGDIIVSIDMSKLDPEEFTDVGIYNLSEFLSTFKLFGENRTVQRDDKTLLITEKEVQLKYITDSIHLLGDFDKDATAFEKTESVPVVAEFTLTTADIGKIKQASKVFKDLSDVSFTSQDGQVIVELKSANKFNAESNTYKLSKNATTFKEFSVNISVENFNVLPNSEYTLRVHYNGARDAYRLILISNEIEDFKILLAINK